MHVRKFLCCIPLKYGVIIVGAISGLIDFILGSIGWDMVISNKFPDYVVEFFRTMNTRTCVAGFSALIWVLMIDHLLLIYGVIYRNLLLIGTWLLINYIVFLFTLVTVLLDGWAIVRIIGIGYCLIVVKSYYTELNVSTPDSSRGASESSEESTA
ncbi:uncharacterized protein LOC108049236 isoform X1 [Drosophila rhopaloa]|uniref:Uncharacterized protein LOC108049236 isoform X1 n=1 Tax=Drosophila rhopaloa TaxID=1041015 RepID=A0A6P4FER9_DRORH|nr:uncharacterized protein LOC108049236 isoform X1 [Drosophila rhopaloa]